MNRTTFKTIDITSVLNKYWKDMILKDKQIETIESFMNGTDTIALLPTGYGKSMCYILPPLITNKVIFIISPLIALMEDQKEKLVEKKIPVSTLHSNNINRTKEIKEIINGNINIVYMSPEYLVQGEGMELAEKLIKLNRMGYLAIDESHCISTWGHDFRSDYMELKNFRINFPTIPILAVTATATKQVVEDIITNTLLKDTKIIRTKFDRPNLYLKCNAIVKKNTKDNMITTKINIIKPYLEKYKMDKIIIYVNSRKDTIELSEEINNVFNKIGINSSPYHAGMTKDMRQTVQENFSNKITNKINCIVCTVAFGMGIDIVVRCVLILGSPNSIENYYQMIGRAGRDGIHADTIFFFQHKNIMIEKKMNGEKMKELSLDNTNINNNIIKEVFQNKEICLNNIVKYFYTNICRRRFILEYFGEIPKFFCCNNCDNCCERDLVDYTDRIKMVVFNKKVKPVLFSDIFNKMELEQLTNSMLISKSGSYYYHTSSLKNWVKLLTLNNFIENVPFKYRLRII